MSKGGKLALAVVGAVGVLAWRRLRPFTVAVEGESMLPRLAPGDWLIALAGARPKRGSIVVLEHPLRPGFEMVKRVDHLPGDAIPGHDPHRLGPDEYWLTGTNARHSTDSSAFGPIAARQLRGVAVFRFRRPGRFELLG